MIKKYPKDESTELDKTYANAQSSMFGPSVIIYGKKKVMSSKSPVHMGADVGILIASRVILPGPFGSPDFVTSKLAQSIFDDLQDRSSESLRYMNNMNAIIVEKVDISVYAIIFSLHIAINFSSKSTKKEIDMKNPIVASSQKGTEK